MKTNRKTHRSGMVSDRVLSAPIAMLLALLLIALAALDGGKVLAQSKRKPTGSRGAQVKPPSAVVADERDPYADPEILAQLANDKLQELTEKEAPELMEALHKAQRINYQVNNKPGCSVAITSAGVRGIRIDYSSPSSRMAWSREPCGPVDRRATSTLLSPAEFGDYSFTIEIRRDGSFIHKSEPCLDGGEKPGCAKGETKVGSLFTR
jgi:hypothetical protein